MAFTFEEFPNADFYRSDLREILRTIREYESKFDSYDIVIAELQEALEGIEGMEDRIAELERATSDLSIIRARLDNIGSDVVQLRRDLDNLSFTIGSIDDTIRGLKDYVDSKVNYLSAEITRKVYLVYSELLAMCNELSRRVDILAEAIANIDTSIYVPWARRIEKEPIQTGFNYGYADLADKNLTAQQYASLGLTAAEYGMYQLSAYEYSVRGADHLHLNWVYSPVFGWRQEISVVLTSVINHHGNTLTAEEYLEYEFTAEDYSEHDITALEYYSWRPPLARVYVEDKVLQCTSGIEFDDGTITFNDVTTIVDGDTMKFEGSRLTD